MLRRACRHPSRPPRGSVAFLWMRSVGHHRQTLYIYTKSRSSSRAGARSARIEPFRGSHGRALPRHTPCVQVVVPLLRRAGRPARRRPRASGTPLPDFARVDRRTAAARSGLCPCRLDVCAPFWTMAAGAERLAVARLLSLAAAKASARAGQRDLFRRRRCGRLRPATVAAVRPDCRIERSGIAYAGAACGS